MNTKETKKKIIQAGQKAIEELIKVAKEKIVDSDDDVDHKFEPHIQLTEDDFVLLGDSWFNVKNQMPNDMKIPEVLTLPSEPVPTSSNIDVEEDALSSPSPAQASNRLDGKEGNAQPLELINPFMLGSRIQQTTSPSTQSRLISKNRIGSKKDISSSLFIRY